MADWGKPDLAHEAEETVRSKFVWTAILRGVTIVACLALLDSRVRDHHRHTEAMECLDVSQSPTCMRYVND